MAIICAACDVDLCDLCGHDCECQHQRQHQYQYQHLHQRQHQLLHQHPGVHSPRTSAAA